VSIILICISNQDQLLPLIDAIKGNLGRKPKEDSADAGYLRQGQCRDPHPEADRGLHCHRSAEARRSRSLLIERMSAKLKRAGHRSRYRLRKQTAEQVFG
jgi:hypothetical protein